MDDYNYRLIFYLGRKEPNLSSQLTKKSMLKFEKLQCLVVKCCKTRKIQPCEVYKFRTSILLYYVLKYSCLVEKIVHSCNSPLQIYDLTKNTGLPYCDKGACTSHYCPHFFVFNGKTLDFQRYLHRNH